MAKRVDAPLVWQADQFTDLSGSSSSAQKFENPYEVLIQDAEHDVARIQERYENHRSSRNVQQRAKLLAADFPGINIDPVLYQLIHDPSYRDPRYCLVFWARPPQNVKNLVKLIQDEIIKDFPDLWLMPQDNLHMTTLEITHSRTQEDEEALVKKLNPEIPQLTDYTYNHKARLIKPIMSLDASAFALSFVPAAGEALSGGRALKDDQYTYHHLRKDMWNQCSKFVEVDSRYIVPSSHLTLGRFIDKDAFTKADGSPNVVKMQKLVAKFDAINEWLKAEYWPLEETSTIRDGGEWIVGEEKGLDHRHGTLWYGGGETVHLGKGF